MSSSTLGTQDENVSCAFVYVLCELAVEGRRLADYRRISGCILGMVWDGKDGGSLLGTLGIAVTCITKMLCFLYE